MKKHITLQNIAFVSMLIASLHNMINGYQTQALLWLILAQLMIMNK